jgi:hypothetical protein
MFTLVDFSRLTKSAHEKLVEYEHRQIYYGYINTRDENPTGLGIGPGPKTLIFGNFKNPEPGPEPEYDFLETLNPKFKHLGPAENPVKFIVKLKLENKTRKQKVQYHTCAHFLIEDSF